MGVCGNKPTNNAEMRQFMDEVRKAFREMISTPEKFKAMLPATLNQIASTQQQEELEAYVEVIYEEMINARLSDHSRFYCLLVRPANRRR